eukprot:14051006-Alexandrium_andersonii.AAC.1
MQGFGHVQKALPGTADASPCSLLRDFAWQLGHLIGRLGTRAECYYEAKRSTARQVVRHCGRHLI